MHRPRRLDLDPELIDRAKVVATRLAGLPQSFRSTVSLAVDLELDAIVGLLEAAGLVSWPGGTPKAREVDDSDWDALGDGAGRVAVDRVGLLRACLVRLARRAADNAQDG